MIKKRNHLRFLGFCSSHLPLPRLISDLGIFILTFYFRNYLYIRISVRQMEINIEVSELVSDLGVAASVFRHIHFLEDGDSSGQESGSEAGD